MAQQLNLWKEITWRNSIVHHVDQLHLSLEELEEYLDDLQWFERRNGEINIIKYLDVNIPNYPQPEFSVSRLKHETTLDGLDGIQDSGGFKAFQCGTGEDLLWWSLVVGPKEVRTAGQGANQDIPLWKFATSPTFTETSSLGSFRFTFTVQEVLAKYRKQICKGEEPVMRVYRTSLFPKKIQYTILIHSPVHNETFSMYPRLKDKQDAVCSYRDGRFIWRSQAMCGTHHYELTDDGQVEPWTRYPQYYLYDSVAIALHMEESQVLKFDQHPLRMNLRFCHRGPEAFRSNVNHIFTSPEDAEAQVRWLWPYHKGNLEEERSLQEKFAVSNLQLVLIGMSGAAMSYSADSILGTNTFWKVSKQKGEPRYWRQSGEVFDSFVTVLNTHQFSQWNLEENIRYFRKEALRADAVLLVISGREKDVYDLINEVETQLGEDVWRYTILLFVLGRMKNPELRPEVQELLERVDSRYVKFSSYWDRVQYPVQDQVETLLAMVEEMMERV